MASADKELIKNAIRAIPDFPKPGILFRDVTTLIMNPAAFQKSIDLLAERYRSMGVDAVAGIESRGFIFGAPLALALKVPFVLIRKKGKLPGKKVRMEYALEYGTDVIEMHEDAVHKGQRLVLFDDLIATGGTMEAGAKLVEQLGGVVVECAFVVELPDLGGRARLGARPVFSLVSFDGH
eukprot:tig00020675_g12597.t1